MMIIKVVMMHVADDKDDSGRDLVDDFSDTCNNNQALSDNYSDITLASIQTL